MCSSGRRSGRRDDDLVTHHLERSVKSVRSSGSLTSSHLPTLLTAFPALILLQVGLKKSRVDKGWVDDSIAGVVLPQSPYLLGRVSARHPPGSHSTSLAFDKGFVALSSIEALEGKTELEVVELVCAVVEDAIPVDVGELRGEGEAGCPSAYSRKKKRQSACDQCHVVLRLAHHLSKRFKQEGVSA